MYFDVAEKIFKEGTVEENKISFVATNGSLTWKELKDLSDKICEALQKTTIPKGHPVIVYGDKEKFFLASLLSCYRLGFPFVPINPALPKNRIEKIIEQTKSEVLINGGDYKDVPGAVVTIGKDLVTKKSPHLLSFPAGEKVSYILFTSGSSGEPKGVLVSDENIISFTKWFTKNFHIDKKTVFINQADLSFDISLADFFGALQTGGTAIFNNSEISNNTNTFFERINKYKGDYWNSTPSFVFKCLADKNFDAENLPVIEQFVLSGENLSTHLVLELKKRFPNARIINAYGPTETTIYASFIEITENLLNENSLPFCKTGTTNVSIKDDEIIISGDKVGLGYLNNEFLTKERFSLSNNKRSFLTGDLALVKNGFVYFNGRKDEQIKFSGYRIELNEIKFVLEKIDFIEQAVCLPIIIDEKVKRLIAFVKLKPGNNPVSSVQEILKKDLPHYMIPSEIIKVKEFPLTTSFKIDKQKLLEDYLEK